MDKEKIGILTFQNTINYGADLQLYALNRILKRIGKNPVIINYKNEIIENREFPKLSKKMLPKKFLRTIIMKCLTSKKKKKFTEFKKTEFIFSRAYNCENFKQLNEEFDKVIVGSDQVWNTELTGKDLNYFFHGLPSEMKRYSYAASFGVGNIESLHRKNDISEALQSFDLITTREVVGEAMVKKLSGCDSTTVLDPTFLLTKEEWLEFGSSKQMADKPFLLIYFVKNKEILENANRYARKNGLYIKYISMKPFAGKGIKTITGASPREFISLISNATVVITGSYHGFILSLNLNVPVGVDLDRSIGNRNARLINIIELLDIKLPESKEKDELSFFTDYNRFNVKLQSLRAKSLTILKEI